MIQCGKCQLSFDPAKTPGGHCPRCLLSVDPGTLDSGGGAPNWEPPSIAGVQGLLPGFEILELIGRGGMGAVYRARQPALDRMVAIKILPPLTDTLGVGYVERFKNEAQLLAKLNHPGIVHVYDFGELPGGLLYFVMEYVDGTDVARLVASQGRLSPEHAASITADVCAALHCAHEAGVVHRDIKPANILVARDGRVKVADFGLAKRADGEARSLTTAGLVLGTADYSAPESLTAGMIVDHRADLYAVGVMLYKMLTGEVPRGVFPPASEKSQTDPGFDQIITKAMQTEPERRYQSAAVMQADVQRASAASGARRSRSKRTRPAVAISVLLAALVLATVVLAVWRWQRTPGAPAAANAVAPAASKAAAPAPRKVIPFAAEQRATAEWVFSKGGVVCLEGETARREAYWSLPKEPFQITEIYFENAAPMGGPITDQDLAQRLPHLPALYQFIILQSPGVAAGITDAGARLFAGLPQMEDIGLDGVRMTDATVRRLAALPKLRTLVLSHSPIHGDSLRPAVSHLRIVSLTYCDIDPAAWKVIAEMSHLELARFIGSPVNDAMVEAILSLKSLRQIGWLADPLTDEALNRIKAGNPKLKVRIFKTWNAAEPPPLRPAP